MQKKCLRCEMFAQLRIDTLGYFAENIDKLMDAEFDKADEAILTLKISNPVGKKNFQRLIGFFF